MAASVLVALVFAAAFGVSTAWEHVAERLRTGAPLVKRWGGHVLVLVGLWMVALAAFAGTFARVFPV